MARDRTIVEAASVDRVEPVDDRRLVHMELRDRAGRPLSIRLSFACLHELIAAFPWRRGEPPRGGAEPAYPVASWAMEPGPDNHVVMTLRTAQGATFSVQVTHPQLAAMAAISSHLTPFAPERPTLN